MKDHAARFGDVTADEIERLVSISAWLRKEREFSFYGDIDFVPTEHYDSDTGTCAIDDARFVVQIAGRVIDG